MHVDNKGKDILILGEELTQGLDDAQLGKRFLLSLHYNWSNSFLFVHATNLYQFKAKNSEIKDCAVFW